MCVAAPCVFLTPQQKAVSHLLACSILRLPVRVTCATCWCWSRCLSPAGDQLATCSSTARPPCQVPGAAAHRLLLTCLSFARHPCQVLVLALVLLLLVTCLSPARHLLLIRCAHHLQSKAPRPLLAHQKPGLSVRDDCCSCSCQAFWLTRVVGPVPLQSTLCCKDPAHWFHRAQAALRCNTSCNTNQLKHRAPCEWPAILPASL